MTAHTAQFDETRFTVDDQFPVALQHFFSDTDWATFTQEVNRHGEEFKLRQEEIARDLTLGYWWCCCLLCCICGPCFVVWKSDTLEEEAARRQEEVAMDFEDNVKQTCRAWQDRYVSEIGMTFQSEKVQQVRGGGKRVTNYRKYWLEFSFIVAARAPRGVGGAAS